MEVWGGNQATFSAFEKAGIDIWLYSRPYQVDANGGDLYYLSSCASGRITRMLLADVAGHGQEVAKVATGLRGVVSRYINSIKPQKLFEDVNEGFVQLPEADRFATSIVASYFSPRSTLSICSAGHPMPMIRPASEGRWKPVVAPDLEPGNNDIPFGLRESAAYTQLDIRVQTGDMLLCFTDGVIESTDENGQQMGVDGLGEYLNSLSADQPEAILHQLVDQIAGSEVHPSKDDDVTIVLLKITDTAIPLRDNLAAPFRWFGSLFSKSS